MAAPICSSVKPTVSLGGTNPRPSTRRGTIVTTPLTVTTIFTDPAAQITAEAIASELGNTDAHPHAMDAANIPGCTYCRPQVASVGLTEAKAKEAGHAVKVGRFPFPGNGKAIAMGETEGFVKTVFDAKTGELLGAHMIGAEVTELIQGYTIGKTLETTEAELMETVFPHPTLSEMMHESVLGAYGRALHI